MKLTSIICPNCHRTNPYGTGRCQHCGSDVVLNNTHGVNDRFYLITRIIKEGGHGAIYQGIDRQGQVYAIKEMLDRFTDPRERSEAITRFKTEVQFLQKLNHPRIPRVYSHFIDRGHYYLVMDLVDGEDLEQIVEREGAIPEARVLEWAIQICNVLEYLHQRGLIYRDMKPSNVMVDHKDGRIKIVDFGIANHFKPAEAGKPIGTQGYSPPEQYQGFAAPTSDIYALGATLHHLLTGRDPREQPPFEFPPVHELNHKVSVATSSAIATALKTEPDERFGTIGEFRSALRKQIDVLKAARRRQHEKHVVIQAPSAPRYAGQVTPLIDRHPQPQTARRAPVGASVSGSAGIMLTEPPLTGASSSPIVASPSQPSPVSSRATAPSPGTPQHTGRKQTGAGWMVIMLGVVLVVIVAVVLALLLVSPHILYHYLPFS
jgi:serine/threonine-protein kinase